MKKTMFLDRNGVGYTPRLTLDVLIDIADVTQAPLGQLFQGNIPPGPLFRSIWFSVRTECEARKITYEDFCSYMGPKEVLAALGALFAVAEEDFPKMGEYRAVAAELMREMVSMADDLIAGLKARALERQADRGTSSTSTSLPEPPASTPAAGTPPDKPSR